MRMDYIVLGICFLGILASLVYFRLLILDALKEGLDMLLNAHVIFSILVLGAYVVLALRHLP